MNLDAAVATFVAESKELLQSMEASLLELESAPQDGEALNAIFRAAHTIKGSAGLFGFDRIVEFTHVVETSLDDMRAGALRADGGLIALLLEAGDRMGQLVEVVAVRRADPDDELRAGLDDLLRRFAALGRGGNAPETVAAVRQAPPAARATGHGCWHVSLRFGTEVFRHGMDPLSFVRYLGTLGEFRSVATLVDGMPEAEAMDPEACHLGFEIDLVTDADREAVLGVFEFVRDDCEIRLVPPHSAVEAYVDLIRALPEDDLRLGEILVAAGVLTRDEVGQALASQAARGQAGGSGPAAQRLGELLVGQEAVGAGVVAAALEKQSAARESKAGANQTVRVNAHKLDDLIGQVGELVTAGASIAVLAQRIGDGSLQEAASIVMRMVDDIRDAALQLRMVAIGETFSRFHRVVRDVSRELGKEIRLEISGAETELDKTVVEKIGDPLLHLVRNAIDHGIEAKEVRVARGKPAAGVLRLHAFHESGGIVIEIADDGGGMTRDRILKKAVERGLVEEGRALSDHEICNLVFEPGFSTAEQVTDLSGRGVGMDVVRRNITALRGTVELDSVEGAGTTVRIRLPLTLAIIDGFLVRAAGAAYVVPLDAVVECIELSTVGQEACAGRDYIDLRGEVLPFIRLREAFGLAAGSARRESVVVVRDGDVVAGLVVDDLLGEHQTVIKPLGRLFGGVKGISGSTILGTGDVALVLDIHALIAGAGTREARRFSRAAAPAPIAAH